MSYRTASSESSEDNSMPSENTNCVFLHIAEGIGLQRARSGAQSQHDQITMHASLNSGKFEIEGHSTETVTIFNSNCIWECSSNDLRRMKLENRPVRIACHLNNGTSCSPPLKLIGTLLLPIRGAPTITTLRNYQPKMLWHKLGALCSDWRPYKPELFLLIVVAKKSLIQDNNFHELLGRKPQLLRSPRTTETASMLQSQSNVYVQLLAQLGLIQVGNNPDIDCDIFLVMLTFKRIKNLAKLLEAASSSSSSSAQGKFVFQYELFGSATNDELTTDSNDSYTFNQKITVKFKASVQSLLMYFQRIFYVPITIYYEGRAIASYRFDCSKYFPELDYFKSHKVWNKNGCFVFDRLHKILSPRASKPSVDFSFSLQLLEEFSRGIQKEIVPLKETFVLYKVDEGAAGDGKSGYLTARSSNSKNTEIYGQRYNRAKSEPMMSYTQGGMVMKEPKDIAAKTGYDTESAYVNEVSEYADACVGTDELTSPRDIGVNTESSQEMATDEASNDTETLTIQMVKELEAWKTQQMDEFLEKLERKEAIYLSNLEQELQKQQNALQQCVEAKNAECAQLKEQLQFIEMECETRKLEDIITAKLEAERNCAQKIHALELDVQKLRLELEQQKRFSSNEKQAFLAEQQQRTKLQQENHKLKLSLAQLEQQLGAVGKTHFSADQLKEMMSDLRKQTERFADVEKQRNLYKEKLAKATRELQQAKLSILKQQELYLLRDSKDSTESLEYDFSFDDTPRDEKLTLNAAFKSKHVESKIASKSFKEMILMHTESATSYDTNESSKTEF